MRRAHAVPVIILIIGMAESQPTAASPAYEIVADVFAQVDDSKMRCTEAYNRLNQLSDDVLIPILIDALNRPGGLAKEGTRSFAYDVLALRGAARTERGFQQLVEGLSEPMVAKTCTEALLNAPEEKQADVLEHILQYLKTTNQTKEITIGTGIDGVLRAIANKGRLSGAYVDAIHRILYDAEQAPELRSTAAWVILRITKLGVALQHFQELDAVGMEAAMTALAEQMGELLEDFSREGKSSYDFYAQNRADIKTARQLVVKALQSARAETQTVAFETMVVAYAPDLIVLSSREDYELNPEIRPILEKIAKNHPDPALRHRARDLLDPEIQRRMVAKILGERAQVREQQPD